MTEDDRIPEHESRGSGHSASIKNYVDKAAIHSLPDIALLEIFDVLREVQSSDPWSRKRKPWYRLVPAHVCSRWRRIILASPKRLDLTIHCGNSTPVSEVLQNSPPFPLDIEYWFREATTTETLDNALLALEYHERIAYIRLSASVEVLERLLSSIKGGPRTFKDAQFALPKALLAGDTPQLSHLHLWSVALPSFHHSFQHLPSIASFRFNIQLGTPQASWMDQVLNALRAMPQLQELHLVFGNHEFSPSSQSARITLPLLLSLTFFGLTDHIEELMSHLDVPSLYEFTVDVRDTFVPLMPLLTQFINQSTVMRSPLAFVGVANECICIRIGDCPVGRGSFTLRACKVNRHSVGDSAIQISATLASAFAKVEVLVLGFDGNGCVLSRYHRTAPDPGTWDAILPAMDAVTALRVDGESSVSLVEALCQPSPVKILPRLRNIRLSFHISDGDTFNPCDVLMRYQPLTEESRDGENAVDVSCAVFNQDNFEGRNDDLKCQLCDW
ncbi:hypothetical protein BC834DRAFT_911540 [Gloeopeniophorella convolvens]|nr:hypothetical protein BC834DRAFT_911540 [Gloeopeniophorella convolvens]